MQLNSRPSPRKQRQAKDVLLAKGVVVSVLSRHGTTASETDGVCALEAVQWLCPWRGDVGQNFHLSFCLRRPKASSSTYFPWKWPRWSDFAFHCVRWWKYREKLERKRGNIPRNRLNSWSGKTFYIILDLKMKNWFPLYSPHPTDRYKNKLLSGPLFLHLKMLTMSRLKDFLCHSWR